MPFTPFHFGPAATIGLAAKKHIDLPTFVLVNIAIDTEPLLVMLFNFNYPLHGYCHTFLIGSLVASLFAVVAYSYRKSLIKILSILRIPSEATFKKILISSILGAWFHILIDSFLYQDIKPFYPSSLNPFLGVISFSNIYFLCALFYIPALFLYSHQKSVK